MARRASVLRDWMSRLGIYSRERPGSKPDDVDYILLQLFCRSASVFCQFTRVRGSRIA